MSQLDYACTWLQKYSAKSMEKKKKVNLIDTRPWNKFIYKTLIKSLASFFFYFFNYSFLEARDLIDSYHVSEIYTMIRSQNIVTKRKEVSLWLYFFFKVFLLCWVLEWDVNVHFFLYIFLNMYLTAFFCNFMWVNFHWHFMKRKAFWWLR